MTNKLNILEQGLVYVGKIIELNPIPDADRIVSATVICGKGGKWKGVMQKSECNIGSLVTVYLPDALIPPNEHMQFMESSNWRVKMRRFKGAPSEVVIMPFQPITREFLHEEKVQSVVINERIGFDCTEIFGVTKYCKPVPANLQGIAKGEFPGFMPKTDELNYQRHGDLVDALHGKPYYITEKADGASTTAFNYKGNFGVCSRNFELLPDEENGYWKVANKYKLQQRLPDGYALQWETCGPKIQSNPMGLKEVDGFAFSGYSIHEKRYLTGRELQRLCDLIEFPLVKIVDTGDSFDKNTVETLGEGTYSNGKQREGVVVRSQENLCGHAPISFKVINLNYEK